MPGANHASTEAVFAMRQLHGSCSTLVQFSPRGDVHISAVNWEHFASRDKREVLISFFFFAEGVARG